MVSNTSEHYNRVKTFMKAVDQEVNETPTMPSRETRLLRARLLFEETLETIHALGFELVIPNTYLAHIKNEHPTQMLQGVPIKQGSVNFTCVSDGDLVKVADGAADVSVVNIGLLVSCGIADNDLLTLVDNNNLDKLVNGVNKDVFGKLIKPAGHKPPDIAKLLEQQSAHNIETVVISDSVEEMSMCCTVQPISVSVSNLNNNFFETTTFNTLAGDR